MRGAKEKGKI